jgi:hypothetical protein
MPRSPAPLARGHRAQCQQGASAPGAQNRGEFCGLCLSWISSVDVMQNCEGRLSRDNFLF